MPEKGQLLRIFLLEKGGWKIKYFAQDQEVQAYRYS
ncbi:MAG: hypothetical protein ACI9CO_002360 [Candidatus Azotimanducaceae bacterium]|jgi:hypothetical protein